MILNSFDAACVPCPDRRAIARCAIFYPILIILLLFPFHSYADGFDATQLTLPVYEVDVDPDDLAFLLENPDSEEEFHALVLYNAAVYPAMLSLRGATARNLPKKSFQIQFTGSTPRGYSEINLNAEYRDMSHTRNLLAMRLGEVQGIPVPACRHVSLVINGEYFGVYVEIEEVDDEFFDRRGIPIPDFLVKSIRHGGAFHPLLNPEETEFAYDFKATTPALLDTFATRRMLFQFGPPSKTAINVGHMIDVENVLSFFALQYAIVNEDGMTKNFYLYTLPDGRYQLVPWDCDASFGNLWTGEWSAAMINKVYFMMTERAGLFTRLMEQEHLREQMRENLQYIADHSFPYLHSFLDQVQQEIRHDVELDTYKQGSMDDFDLAFERLHEFLTGRAARLDGLDAFDKVPITGYGARLVHDEDDDGEEDEVSVLFTAVTEPASVSMRVRVGTGNSFATYPMYDDGDHGDEVAGDGIWSAIVEIEHEDLPQFYCYTSMLSGNVLYWHPSSGPLEFQKYRSQLPSLPRDFNHLPEPGDLEFGPMWRSDSEDTWLATLINRTDEDVDLYGLSLRFDNTYHWYGLAPCDTIAAGDTLFLASDPDIERGRAPWRHVFGPIPLNLPDAMHLSLTSYDDQLLAEADREMQPVQEIVGRAVINEICYHGSEHMDPGDWVEIVFADTIESIEGWKLYDELDLHEYRFTVDDNSRRVHNHGFLVVAEDVNKFRSVFANVGWLAGSCGFGFANSGEAIRLYDSTGILVDMVRYMDDDPWPSGADGTGRTIELVHVNQPNSDPANWNTSANTAPFGTPGKENSVAEDDTSSTTPSDENYWAIANVSPNPADSHLSIHIHTPQRGPFQFKIFNLLGQPVASLTGWADRAGVARVDWDCSRVASGMYFIRLDEGSETRVRKVVVIK